MSENKPARGGGGATALGWVLTIGLNVVAPLLTYNNLVDHGHGEVTALLLSGLWPVVDVIVYLAWHRRVDEFAAITLVFLAITVLVTVAGPNSARLLLVKDSLVTGLFGVVCLVSLAAPRPLMFYFGRKFGTDGSAEGLARWNGLWQFEGFRRVQRNLTLGWGLGYVVEAIVRVGLAYVLSTGAMVAVNSVLAYAVTGLLVLWTVLYAKRARARGAAAAAASAVTAG
ncbi:VC0807 family protein [Streptomyces sp. NRRL B-24484]|uniref:VC0807 family protein n=1 Tax=Streptomyces sp. NRRL B-24484 TaxID=1463833 RepID=UPI0005BD4F9C|nr:VC0807 family protein [Streptomyces sp. NRRL B-24484]